MLAVRNCCYVAVCSAALGASVPTGRRGTGAYRGGRRLQLVSTLREDEICIFCKSEIKERILDI